MSLVILSSNTELIAEVKDKKGLFSIETAAAGGHSWPTGATVEVEIQSPMPGEEHIWKNIHTFTDEGSIQRYLVVDRVYRFTVNTPGIWVWLSLLSDVVTNIRDIP